MIYLWVAVWILGGGTSYALYLVLSRTIGSKMGLLVLCLSGPVSIIIVLAWLINDSITRNRINFIKHG